MTTKLEGEGGLVVGPLVEKLVFRLPQAIMLNITVKQFQSKEHTGESEVLAYFLLHLLRKYEKNLIFTQYKQLSSHTFLVFQDFQEKITFLKPTRKKNFIRLK